MKSIFGFISLVVVSSFTLCLKEPINFEYKYKVISASNSPYDIQQAYIYKEKLIEQYEKLVFNFEQRDYQQIIKDNISSFEFSSCCNAYYNGKINLIIGKGLGLTFSGDLKHNICDENAIREKFYIFEIFN